MAEAIAGAILGTAGGAFSGAATGAYERSKHEKEGRHEKIRTKRISTIAPTLTDIDVGEIAIGDGTGLAGQDELFFKPDDWEMGVEIVVLPPPHDWARIYLRHRFTEAYPSYAFEISSLKDVQEEPHAIDPPESVWR